MLDFIKIKETCLYVQDLATAHHFYHEVLGLPVIHYLEEKHLFLRVGASVLLLFNPEDSSKKQSPPPHFANGPQHFAFEVAADRYDEAKQAIAQKGIDIIDEVTWKTGKKSFYFRDPAGNVLEIVPENGIWEN